MTRQLVIGSRGQPHLEMDPRLAQELAGAPASAPRAGKKVDDSGIKVRRKPSDVSEAELKEALREADWDLKAAADRLGVPRPSMYDLIDRSPSIRTAGDLGAERDRALPPGVRGRRGGDGAAAAGVGAGAEAGGMKELGLGVKRA